MQHPDRIVKLAGQRLEKMQLAGPELREALEDGLELGAALAGGDEMALEGRETGGGEGVADGMALLDLAREDGRSRARRFSFPSAAGWRASARRRAPARRAADRSGCGGSTSWIKKGYPKLTGTSRRIEGEARARGDRPRRAGKLAAGRFSCAAFFLASSWDCSWRRRSRGARPSRSASTSWRRRTSPRCRASGSGW